MGNGRSINKGKPPPRGRRGFQKVVSFAHLLYINCANQKGAQLTMISITQDLKSKQEVVEYSFKHGVTAAAKRYKRTRQWIYYWRKRY